MAERKKIVKYRRPFDLNIGVVIFVIIFIYIVFNVFSYLNAKHIAVYEVGQGTIAENNTYQGLILRDEKIINSKYSGYIDYYLRDTAKTSYQNLVCSVDENGYFADKIASSSAEGADLEQDDYRLLQDMITGFSDSFNDQRFYQVYSFQEELKAKLMEAINQKALDTLLKDYASDVKDHNSTFHLVYAKEPGIVVYYTDGYENLSMETFSPDAMNALNYTKTNLKQQTQIKAGDPAYKLITSEDWQIVFPVSEDTYQRLSEESVVEIQFQRDGVSCWVNYTFQQIQGKHYMVLSLKNHMVRFANDRFVEIELLLDEETGLKIPNSTIIKKTFFTVPKEYFTKGGDSNNLGLLVSTTDESGKSAMVFEPTNLYSETDDVYYIEDSDLIHTGTVIMKPDSSETYTIRDTAELDGVYNVNKGYAVFKQIDVLFQNDEYTIVRTGTSYGIALYDHIALEGNKLAEGELLQE